MSAPPECCIAGADGQPWRCGSAWLVAFHSSRLHASRSRYRGCWFRAERERAADRAGYLQLVLNGIRRPQAVLAGQG